MRKSTLSSLISNTDFRDRGLVPPIFRHINAEPLTEKHNILSHPQCQRRGGYLQRMIQSVKAWLYLLEVPQSYRPSFAEKSPRRMAAWATCSALHRKHLAAWEGKKRAEVGICSQATLLHPSAVGPCSSRDWGEKGGQRESRKTTGEREWGLDASNASWSTGVQPLPAPWVKSRSVRWI